MTRLYPTSNEVFIPGVPAVEQDVDDKEEAKRLLSHSPPAFTTKPPKPEPKPAKPPEE